MSVFEVMENFIELLIALCLIAGNNSHYVWSIALLSISKLIFKRKNLHFLLFLSCLNILKEDLRRRWPNYSKHRLRESLKPLHTYFPKESPAYFWRCMNSTVYFFTQRVGCSDEQNESSDEDSNPKEESSEHCGESQGETSDFEAEKPDVTTTPEPPSTPQKRKAEAELEIDMKRSRFGDAPDESASALRPGSKTGTKVGGMINRPPFPGTSSSNAAGDSLRSSFGSFGHGFGGAPVAGNSAEMRQFYRQAVKDIKPEKLEFDEFQSPVFQPEKIITSPESPSSEESQQEGRMTFSAAARTSEIPSPKIRSPKNTWPATKERKSYPHKKFRSYRLYNLDDSQHCARGVSLSESRDSYEKGENRATSSQCTDNKVPVSERDVPEIPTADVPREGIAEATTELCKELEKKPVDPRMRCKNEVKSRGGNHGHAKGCSSSSDFTIDPLSLPGPSSGFPQQPFEPPLLSPISPPQSPARPPPQSLVIPPPLSPSEINGTRYVTLPSGYVQCYRNYPGLSLQPFSVKKDANYQKRFYREKKSLVMPVKMGKIIRWCIELSKDLASNVPRYSISDEDKLPLEDYRKLSRELMKGFMKPYGKARDKRMKRRKIRKLKNPPRKANSSEDSEPELPSDTSSDESVKSCDSKASRSRTSSEENSAMVLPQPANASPKQDRGLPAVAPPPSPTHAQHLEHSNEVGIVKVIYNYGNYSSRRYPVQPVQIKFVTETPPRSRRLIFCRDNLSSQSDEHSRLSLKPFFEVEEVLEVHERCPSVSVEEFLKELLESQELYYQMLYEGTKRFYTLRRHMYRCVIPLRSGGTVDDDVDDGDNELDGDTLKTSTSRSGQSSKSLDVKEEASSTSGNGQQQTQSDTKENDGVQHSDEENADQSQKSRHCTEICIQSTSGAGLPSHGETWESSVRRSESRSLSSRYPGNNNNNLAEWPTSETVEEKKPLLVSAVDTSTNARGPSGTVVVRGTAEMSLDEQLEILDARANTSVDDQFLIQETLQASLENLDSHNLERVFEEEQRAILESLLLSVQCSGEQQENQPHSAVHDVGNASCIEHFSSGTSKLATQSPSLDDSGPSTSSTQLQIVLGVRSNVRPEKKHVVWCPPLAEEVDQGTGLNRASDKSEKHSTSGQQNLPQSEMSSESTDSAEEDTSGFF